MDSALSPHMSMPLDITDDSLVHRSSSSCLGLAMLKSHDSLHRPPTPLDSCGDELNSYRKNSIIRRRASRFASSTDSPPQGWHDSTGACPPQLSHDVLHSPLASRTSCSPCRMRSRLGGHSSSGAAPPVAPLLSTSPPSMSLLQMPSSPHALASPFGAGPVTPRSKSVAPSRISNMSSLVGSLSMADALDQLSMEAKPQPGAMTATCILTQTGVGRGVISGPLAGAESSWPKGDLNLAHSVLPMQYDSLSSWASTQQLGFRRKGSSGF